MSYFSLVIPKSLYLWTVWLYHVSQYLFFFFFPVWSSLSSLNVYIHVFHQIWDVFSHYFFSPSNLSIPFLSSRTPTSICWSVWCPTGHLDPLLSVLQSFFLFLNSTISITVFRLADSSACSNLLLNPASQFFILVIIFSSTRISYSFFFFAFFFFLFRTTLLAYGGSQARGRIRATAASLHHSHSNVRSPTHWARPGIEPVSSWILVRFISAEPRWELQHQNFFVEFLFGFSISLLKFPSCSYIIYVTLHVFL